MSSAPNSTSTTGPITRATRPVPSPAACVSAACSAVAMMVFSLTPGRIGQRVRAADDLAYFLGNLGLPGLVGVPRELFEQVVGIVGRRLHGPPPGGDLGRRRIEQGLEDPALDIPGQQFVQHPLG